MRSKFDEQLTTLNHSLVNMGAMCEESIALAAKSILTTNKALENRMESLQDDIYQSERDIESLCLMLLLQQQPVARDLRLISAALKMITDMERIGTQAADIVEISGFITDHIEDDSTKIEDMARCAVEMLTTSIDCFVKQDYSTLYNVNIKEEETDKLFGEIRKRLIEMIENKEKSGEYVIDLLMVAKYFERIADHALNISQWVMFSLTGIHRGELEP
jgi:phosphate transport system protein